MTRMWHGMAGVLLATAALGVAGCGGGNDDGGSAGSGSSTQESAGSTDPAQLLKGKSLTFVSFGGAYQDAQTKAMVTPAEQQFGVTFKQDGPTDYAKIKTQVASQQVSWDVVDSDPFFALQQCDKLVEPIDTNIVDTSKMPKELVSKCAVPSMTYSYVLAYNKDKYGDNPPQGWKDFFDTQKFPGKRALWNYSQGGGYEAALLADGVPADKLYPIDYDRAFKKLDAIKDDLVFWESGAQSQQMAESGEVDMMLIWSGRLYAAVQNGSKFAPQWNQNMAVYDVFMVPKGVKDKDAAMGFISYATGPEAQAKLTENIPYAPINSDAQPKVTGQLKSYLPTQPDIKSKSVLVDQQWWADNYDEATQRWTAWQAG
jgi:putative spermidine/putrescine transport system substrate-binding protein